MNRQNYAAQDMLGNAGGALKGLFSKGGSGGGGGGSGGTTGSGTGDTGSGDIPTDGMYDEPLGPTYQPEPEFGSFDTPDTEDGFA